MEISTTYSKLPRYLQKYVVSQNYEKYTAKDQAVWRFIMRQSRDFFSSRAHGIWLSGLKDTGIQIENIPRIEEMDKALQKYGWGACCICGFIPPAAFLDFLARRVLPIAADIRSADHVAYTPAPDIVHEAAGHAPILADEGYRDYLIHYAKLARRAIFSDEDIKLYEAIRLLSDLKENPDSNSIQIAEAQSNLDQAVSKMTWVSEASQVARMSWWTIEYGLIGEMNDPKIYGAGLLSSIGESLDCYGDNVKKLPLSLSCVDQGYDITEPQPQLFVAKDFGHMNAVLLELENNMAFKKGGIYGLELAKKAKTITTTVFENGVSVSGKISDIVYHDGQLAYLKWEGEVQIAYREKELPNQGIKHHPAGFSMPIGTLRGTEKNVSKLTSNDLNLLGLEVGLHTYLQFSSGLQVDGSVKNILIQENQALMITWSDCTVRFNNQVLYQPEWGDFDMPFASAASSVYGGPADWEAYGDYDVGKASSVPGRQSPFSPEEIRIHALFSTIREYRETSLSELNWSQIKEIASEVIHGIRTEWLLAIEILELVQMKAPQLAGDQIFLALEKQVLDSDDHSPEIKKMIKRGQLILKTGQ